jgi:hypothetical protein
MQSAIGVNRIPSLQTAVDVSNYYYLNEGGDSIYYILGLQADCSDLTVRINRTYIETIEVSIGDVILLPTSNQYVFMVTSEPYVGIQLNAINLTLLGDFTMYKQDDEQLIFVDMLQTKIFNSMISSKTFSFLLL